MQNPDEPPQASITLAAQPGVRRSRWALLRFIPVSYFGLFTVAFLFNVLVGSVLLTYTIMTQNFGFLATFAGLKAILSILVCGLTSVVGFATTRAWYRCRWKAAILWSILLFALLASGAWIIKHYLIEPKPLALAWCKLGLFCRAAVALLLPKSWI